MLAGDVVLLPQIGAQVVQLRLWIIAGFVAGLDPPSARRAVGSLQSPTIRLSAFACSTMCGAPSSTSRAAPAARPCYRGSVGGQLLAGEGGQRGQQVDLADQRRC